MAPSTSFRVFFEPKPEVPLSEFEKLGATDVRQIIPLLPHCVATVPNQAVFDAMKPLCLGASRESTESIMTYNC
jgi:hypothetical protein